MSTIKFGGEFFGGAEWERNPDGVEIYLDSEWQERIKIQAKALMDSGGNVMVTWWAGSYEFFDDDGEVFDPNYSIDGCHMHVFANGDFRFLFPFKHSTDEGFTQDFKWADGVLMEEAA